jgi:transposase
MVSKWRGRFLRDRLEGLSDEPRLGRPRKISDEQVERVVTATLEQAPPGGDAHWSTRSMARSAGMSQTAISRIWRAFGLQPGLTDGQPQRDRPRRRDPETGIEARPRTGTDRAELTTQTVRD